LGYPISHCRGVWNEVHSFVVRGGDLCSTGSVSVLLLQCFKFGKGEAASFALVINANIGMSNYPLPHLLVIVAPKYCGSRCMFMGVLLVLFAMILIDDAVKVNTAGS
jgi:hypothetical protein